jgi:hypothetical protein
MKRNLLFGTIVLLTGSLVAADSSPKDDVNGAAKKLSEKSNYSWKMTMDFGPNSPFTPGPTMGKTEKGGYTYVTSEFNDNISEGVLKDKKVAVKTEDGWKSAEEVTGGGGGGGGGGFGNPGAFMARRMQNLKVPAAEVEDLVSKAKELKKEGDVFSGDLTEDGAKTLLTTGFRGRGGGQPPQASNAKGSLKFWLKDGALTKYEYKVSGRREFNGEEIDVERTVTVEIKDVGNTKIEVPEDARKKVS